MVITYLFVAYGVVMTLIMLLCFGSALYHREWE